MAPPLEVATRAERVVGAEKAKERLLYADADATVDELLAFAKHPKFVGIGYT